MPRPDPGEQALGNAGLGRGFTPGDGPLGLLGETETPRPVLQVRLLTANSERSQHRLTVNPKMLQAGDKQ